MTFPSNETPAKTILTKAEPLLLYMVLFFPALFAEKEFSINSLPLERVLLFYLPAFFLLFFLLYHLHGLKKEEVYPRSRDIWALASAFVLLLCIQNIMNFLFQVDELAAVSSMNFVQYCLIAFFFIIAGYLEELYFRFYLLRKNPKPSMIIFSTILFVLCHKYQGPAGMFNAACAGLVLSFIFIKSRSLHGIAIAHGLYNIVQAL